MSDARSADDGLSLKFEVLDDGPDAPVLSVLVNGEDAFADVASGWRGFDPGTMLGADSPLLPSDNGRRVAVYRCSCGEPGCGVIAPLIVPSPDGTRVSWVDFRDYVGVFSNPVQPAVDRYEGKLWNLPDLHFDRNQYVAEIQRATSDRSWETPRRRTARLLHARLEPMGLVLPPNLTLAWVSPAWEREGVSLMFQHATREPDFQIRQQMLHLTSTRTDPAEAAADMADQLLAVLPDRWARTFGVHIG